MKLLFIFLILSLNLACKKESGSGFVENQAEDGASLVKLWEKVFDEKDFAMAAYNFKVKYGLPLKTYKQVGAHSYLAESSDRGNTYISFTDSTDGLTKSAWEIDIQGKILNRWRYNGTLMGITANELLSSLTLFSNPNGSGKSETLFLRIASDGTYNVVPGPAPKVLPPKLEPMDCPELEAIPSDTKYCVKTEDLRILVLQK